MSGTTALGGKYTAYTEYKDSGLEWLGQIPALWKPIKFGITNASAVLGGNYIAGEGEEGIPVIKMGNLGRGLVNLKKVENLPRNETFENEHILKEDDFLFNTRNSLDLVGKVAIWRGELERAVYNSNILRITFYDKFVDSTAYVNYLFNSALGLSQLRLIAKGTTSVAAIYYKELSSLVFAFPPIIEQQQIANFLDHETAKIDTLIDKQQQLIILLKEKRQAVISHAVTKGLNPNAPMRDSGVEWVKEIPEHWDMLRLSFALKLQSGDTITSDNIEKTGKYLVYGGNGVRGYTSRYNCDGEYVLIGRQGALCGNINMASGQFFASEHAVVVYPRKPFNNIYLAEILRYMDLGQYSVSAAQPGVSVERLDLLKVIMPPESEQITISKVIIKENSVFESLTKKCDAMIALLRERRTALISAAVTGKIDVRNWQAPQAPQASNNNKEVAV
jgi:type I restriction enzyme S subunit